MCSKAAPLAALALCLAVFQGLLGCGGYTFSAKTPYELPGAVTTIYLGSVDNPSIETWLEPKLRNELRDELTRRGNIAWADKQEAGGRLELTIHNFRSSAKLEDPRETTVRSEMILRMELKLFAEKSREQLAGSGLVTARESFNPRDRGNELQTRDRVVKLAVELAVQRLNQNF